MSSQDRTNFTSDAPNDDKVAWGHERESYFIDLLVDEVRKGNLSSSTFHNRIWTQIEAQMYAKYSRTYTTLKLKQKFNRLRSKWKIFRDLKGHTGFGWDDELQTVTAPDKIWKEEILKNKEAGQFRKKGCDNFDKLTEIFGESTATGDLARASTQGPLSSNEEREVEEVYIRGPNSSYQDVSMNDYEDGGISKPSPSTRKDKKRGKGSTSTPLVASKVVDEAWMAFKNTQESKKAMFDRIEKQVKAGDCIQLLESMDDISEDQYVKAVAEFKDPSVREMFVVMSDPRRRQWLRSLTH